MHGPRVPWLVVIAIAMVACFVVPFTLLRDVEAWYGSFLFWSLVSAGVIAINVLVSSDWEDEA